MKPGCAYRRQWTSGLLFRGDFASWCLWHSVICLKAAGNRVLGPAAKGGISRSLVEPVARLDSPSGRRFLALPRRLISVLVGSSLCQAATLLLAT
jgi:hypothetical protein